jgi:hypothetical protein
VCVCVLVWRTVAPVYDARDNTLHARMVACVHAVLDAAVANGLPRVALCGLGAGVFGWSQSESARLIVLGLREWFGAHPGATGPSVVLYDFAPAMAAAFRDALVAAEADVGAACVTAVAPPAAPIPPFRATHQWQRQDGPPGVVEADKWVSYDFDQNRQLEQAWARNPAGTETLTGDLHGVKYVRARNAGCAVCEPQGLGACVPLARTSERQVLVGIVALQLVAGPFSS